MFSHQPCYGTGLRREQAALSGGDLLPAGLASRHDPRACLPALHHLGPHQPHQQPPVAAPVVRPHA